MEYGVRSAKRLVTFRSDEIDLLRKKGEREGNPSGGKKGPVLRNRRGPRGKEKIPSSRGKAPRFRNKEGRIFFKGLGREISQTKKRDAHLKKDAAMRCYQKGRDLRKREGRKKEEEGNQYPVGAISLLMVAVSKLH